MMGIVNLDKNHESTKQRGEYLETALNQYFESNNLSLDESILASPLLSDYVNNSSIVRASASKDHAKLRLWSEENDYSSESPIRNCPYNDDIILEHSESSLQTTWEDEQRVTLLSSRVEDVVHSPTDQENAENINRVYENVSSSGVPEPFFDVSNDNSLGLGSNGSSRIVNEYEPIRLDDTILLNTTTKSDPSFLGRDRLLDSRSSTSISTLGSKQTIPIEVENVSSPRLSDKIEVEFPSARKIAAMKDPDITYFMVQHEQSSEWMSPVLDAVLNHPEHELDSYKNDTVEEQEEDALVQDNSPFHEPRRFNQHSSLYNQITTHFTIDEENDQSKILSPQFSDFSCSITSSNVRSFGTHRSLSSSHELRAFNDKSSAEEDSFFSPTNIKQLSDFNSNKLTPVDKRDSFLSLSHDLSSAKKHLNAHSTSLMKQLKGAFQRRTLNLAQTQSSLSTVENSKKDAFELELNHHTTVAPSQPFTKKVTFSQECQESKRSKDMTLDENNVFIETSKAVSRALDKIKNNPRRAVLLESSANVELGRQGPDFYVPFKARPLPTSTMDSTGQSGVPKVSKRPVTIPKSPQLGARRVCNAGGKKNDSDGTNAIGLCQTVREFKSNTTPDNSTQGRVRETPDASDCDTPSKDTYLHGLEFLAATPYFIHQPQVIHVNDVNVRNSLTENVYPFTLHSTVRAKNRQDFEKHRIEKEMYVRKQRMALLDAIIKNKQAELKVLKPLL